MKFLILLFFALFFSVGVFAQGTASGCLLPTEQVVYTSLGSKGIYDDISTSLSNNYCSWSPNTTNVACKVCKTGLNGGGNCNGSIPVNGVEGVFTMVPCPIDENYVVFGFGFLISIVSFRKIRLLQL